MSKYGYPIGFKPSPNQIYKATISHTAKKSKNYSVNSIIKSVNIYYENDYFHYAEYRPGIFSSASQPAGSYLDGEHIGFHGWGISFQNILTKQIPIWYKASYSYLPGSGTYDEPTGITDISHSSNMTRYGFRLGYVFHIGNRIALIPNFGYQWVNWNRKLPGLNSDYYHLNYYMLGLKAYYIPPVLNNKLWIEGEGYYINDINDTVDLGFTGPGSVYEAPYVTNGHYNFTMAPKAGYIFGLKMGYQLYKRNNLSINPFIGVKYGQNKMGRSNVNYEEGYKINENVYSEEVLEPSDQYNQIFLQFGLKLGY